MRKPAALFVAAFATVAGGGLAVAVEGSPASSTHDEPPTGPPFADMEWVGDLPPGPPAHAASVQETTTTTAAADEVVEVEVEDEVEAPDDEAGPPADTHGAAVSAAAQECPTDDPAQNHGQCVSEVARDNRGHADDDEVEEPEVEDDADDAPRAGHSNSNGRGHELGRGHGHDADD